MKYLTRSALRHAPTLARRVKTQLRPHSARPYAISPPKQTCEQYASKHRATTQPCTTSQRIRKQWTTTLSCATSLQHMQDVVHSSTLSGRRSPRPRRDSPRAHILRSRRVSGRDWLGLIGRRRSHNFMRASPPCNVTHRHCTRSLLWVRARPIPLPSVHNRQSNPLP